MLLFHLFLGTTSLKIESRNLLLECSLLAGDATFVLWHCINCIWGFLRSVLMKCSTGWKHIVNHFKLNIIISTSFVAVNGIR